MPVKERLGGANPQRVLTQSQTSVVVDEAAAKQATEAKEKEREKVFCLFVKCHSRGWLMDRTFVVDLV